MFGQIQLSHLYKRAMIEFIIEVMVIGVAYLLGSVPFGLLLARYKGAGDIRTMGSGNIGATNVFRTSGKTLGAATLALDAGKGAMAVLLARWLGSEWTVAFAGAAAVLGHVFPVWLDFKGGKGVATTLAVYWAAGWPVGLFASFVWVGMFAVSRISSLSSLSAVLLSPVIALFFTSAPVFVMTLFLGGLVIQRHKENIGRLVRGEEKPVKSNIAVAKTSGD